MRNPDPSYPKITFNTPLDLKKWLLERAEIDDITLSKYIIKALKAYKEVVMHG